MNDYIKYELDNILYNRDKVYLRMFLKKVKMEYDLEEIDLEKRENIIKVLSNFNKDLFEVNLSRYQDLSPIEKTKFYNNVRELKHIPVFILNWCVSKTDAQRLLDINDFKYSEDIYISLNMFVCTKEIPTLKAVTFI